VKPSSLQCEIVVGSKSGDLLVNTSRGLRLCQLKCIGDALIDVALLVFPLSLESGADSKPTSIWTILTE
jgi:hypothetical protein